jgi:hypothetical protein
MGGEEKRKREPVEPLVLAPGLEMPFRRRHFLLEAEKKVPKETAFTSLAAALTGIRI